jgi:hypothetical protein
MKKYQIAMAWLLCLAVNHSYGQYGALAYLHNNSFLTSAKKTDINMFGPNPFGWVMAGVFPTATGTQDDFTVEKVKQSGAWGIGAFSRNYNITCDPNCASPINMPYPHKCTGVDIIEIPPVSASNEKFALAGVFAGGIFFATLDGSGFVTSQRFWAAPGILLGKPTICRSSNINNFYICGSYNTSSYVIKVNFSGTVLWSKLYNNMLIEARDMLESPYNNNELIVVGKCQFDSWLAHDAFFLSLNSGNGAINNFMSYCDGLSGDEYFSSIEPAVSPTGGNGFIVGGHLVSNANPPFVGKQSWMIRLDMNGNVIWSSLMPHTSEVYDVFERYNPIANPIRYEYFGVGRSGSLPNNNELRVWKLDESGGASMSPNVFDYGLGTTVAGVNDITYPQIEFFRDGTNLDDGLAVFGTDVSTNRFNFIKAYYNGVNGCETTTDMSIVNGPGIWTSPVLTSINFINPCIYFLINSPSNPGQYNSACTWGYPAGGSNARMAETTAIHGSSAAEELLSVYPNPSNGAVTLEIAGHTGAAQIKVMSAAGQLIKKLELHDAQKIVINFKEMTLSEGLYFLNITIDNQTQIKKVIYQK